MKPTQCEQCLNWLRPGKKCSEGCTGRYTDKSTELLGSLFRLGMKFSDGRTTEELIEEAVSRVYLDAELIFGGDSFRNYWVPELQSMSDGDVYLMMHSSGDVYVWLDEVVRRNCEIDGTNYQDTDLSQPLKPYKSAGREISRGHLKLVR